MTEKDQRVPDRPTMLLYHAAGSRSERVRWTAMELELDFELAAPGSQVGRRLVSTHPLSRVPAVCVHEGALFESLAICNWLSDSHPHANLGWRGGTWQRALHDQWSSFTLAELEANLWHTARNKFVYPEDRKVPQVYSQNSSEACRALKAFDGHLQAGDWLVGDRFSLTDIFCGFAIAWASMDGLTGEFRNVENYLTRLLAQANCPYRRSR